MNLDRSKIMIGVIVLILCLFGFRLLFPSYGGPSVIADPVQTEMKETVIDHIGLNGESVQLVLMAEYEGQFAVQGVKKYQTDGASAVSSRDFILSWGELPSKSIDDEIDYSQRNRWYYYTYSAACPVESGYISNHSANTHIIAANDYILKNVEAVKENDYVYLKGYLVRVKFQGGDWTSSMTRKDTGDGSCEILYVTEINR